MSIEDVKETEKIYRSWRDDEIDYVPIYKKPNKEDL